MIARYDIEQRTPAWYEVRWGKIGSTRASQLFTKTDALLIDLVSEHIEPFELDEDGYMGADMIRGIELEDEARNQLSKYIGVELLKCGWLQCEEMPMAGISPDGISADHKIGAEIKSPARKKHTRTILDDAVPIDDLDQCIHFFTVNPELEKLYYCSFRPESVKPLFVKELTRETTINFGTKAKPVMKTIAEAVVIAKVQLKDIDREVKEKVERLNF